MCFRSRCANQVLLEWLYETIIFTAMRERKAVFGFDPDGMT